MYLTTKKPERLAEHILDVKRDIYNTTYGISYENFLMNCIKSIVIAGDTVKISLVIREKELQFAYTKFSRWRQQDWIVEFMGTQYGFNSYDLQLKVQELICTKIERTAWLLKRIDWYAMYIDNALDYNRTKKENAIYLNEIRIGIAPTAEEIEKACELIYDNNQEYIEKVMRTLGV